MLNKLKHFADRFHKNEEELDGMKQADLYYYYLNR